MFFLGQDRKKATSLIELIIIVAVIAIISAITLVSFSLFDKRRLEANALSLLSDLGWTREMAASSHQNYSISFDRANERYTITDGGGNQVKPTQRLEVDISVSPDTLTFQYPLGTMALSPASDDIIRLDYRGRRREITLYPQTGYLDLSEAM